MAHHHNHNHDHEHDHFHSHTKHITLAFWLNTIFGIVELVGGLYINSMAILSSALHDFGDSLSLGLSYYFQRKSRQRRDEQYSYGYRRFSLLGAFVNSVVLIVGSIFILQESIHRLFHPEASDARGMLVLAIIGVAVNLFAMLRLRKGHSLNERVVSLHFLEDTLGWAAVLIGSVVLLFRSVPILDPLLSMFIAAFVLYNVFRNMRHAFKIILQGIPGNVDIPEIQKKLQMIPDIVSTHDVHAWTLDGQYNVMTLHVVVKPGTSLVAMENIKQEVRHALQHRHIQHITIEIETENVVCELKEC